MQWYCLTHRMNSSDPGSILWASSDPGSTLWSSSDPGSKPEQLYSIHTSTTSLKPRLDAERFSNAETWGSEAAQPSWDWSSLALSVIGRSMSHGRSVWSPGFVRQSSSLVRNALIRGEDSSEAAGLVSAVGRWSTAVVLKRHRARQESCRAADSQRCLHVVRRGNNNLIAISSSVASSCNKWFLNYRPTPANMTTENK